MGIEWVLWVDTGICASDVQDFVITREADSLEPAYIPDGASENGNDWAWFGLSPESIADALQEIGGDAAVYNISIEGVERVRCTQQAHMFHYGEIGWPLFAPVYTVLCTAADTWQPLKSEGVVVEGQMKATVISACSGSWVDGLGTNGLEDGYYKGPTHGGASGACLWSDRGRLLGVNNHQGRAVVAQQIFQVLAQAL